MRRGGRAPTSPLSGFAGAGEVESDAVASEPGERLRRLRIARDPSPGRPLPRTARPLPQREKGGPAISPALIRVGEFGRAVGLRGELRLKSYTAEPLAVASYGPLRTGHGRTIVITAVRPASGEASDMLVARVEGVATREAAEALNRVTLLIERDRLAPPDEDEFYLADLVGLAVHDAEGPIGRVVAVPDYGGGDLLEIAPADGGPTVLLPFTKAFVPLVDVAGGRIVIDPPPDLFAEPAPEPEPPS